MNTQKVLSVNIVHNRCWININCYRFPLCLPLWPQPAPTMATNSATTIITTISQRKVKKLSLPDRLFPKVPELLKDSGRMKPLSLLTIPFSLPGNFSFFLPLFILQVSAELCLSLQACLWALAHHLTAPCASQSQNFSSCFVLCPLLMHEFLKGRDRCGYYTSAFQYKAQHQADKYLVNERLTAHSFHTTLLLHGTVGFLAGAPFRKSEGSPPWLFALCSY